MQPTGMTALCCIQAPLYLLQHQAYLTLSQGILAQASSFQLVTVIIPPVRH